MLIYLQWLCLFLMFLLFEQIGNLLAKQFALSNNYRFAVLALLSFVICELPWIFSLCRGLDLSRGAVLFAVIPGIGAVMLGRLIYHERISRFQYLGLLFGIAATALLTIGTP